MEIKKLKPLSKDSKDYKVPSELICIAANMYLL